MEVARQHDSKKDFQSYAPDLFATAVQRDLLDDACAHMTRQRKWTRAALDKVVANYENQADFRDHYPSA